MSVQDRERMGDAASTQEEPAKGVHAAGHAPNEDDGRSTGATQELHMEHRSAPGSEEPTATDVTPIFSDASGGVDMESDDGKRKVPLILSPPDGTVASTGSVTLSGTSEPSSRILVRDWLLPVGQVVADDAGRWSSAIANLDGGTHIFVAELIDEGRNVLASSPGCTIQVSEQPTQLDALSEEPAGFRGLRRLLPGRRLADRRDAADVDDEPQPAEEYLSPEREVVAEAPVAETGLEFPNGAEPAGAYALPDALRTPVTAITAVGSVPRDGTPVQDIRGVGDQAEPGEPVESHTGTTVRILHPTDESHVGTTVTLFGTAPPGSLIDILENAVLVAVGESDKTGYWGVLVEYLTPGRHQLQARSQAEKSGNEARSAWITVVVEKA